MRTLLLISLLAVGCAREPAPAPPPVHTEKMKARARPPVVANRGAIRAMLTGPDRPLPTKAQLDVHGDADHALRAIALEDTSIRVRKRAIASLRHYPDPATRRLLRNMIGAPKLHADLKAAAQSTHDRIEAAAPDDPEG